jgi:hypothetical protein
MKPPTKSRKPISFRWPAPVVELLEGRLPPAAHTLAAALLEPPVGVPAAERSGSLAAHQHDLYRVHLDSAAQLRASVTAQTGGSGLLPLLRVFAASGRELALNNQEGGDPQLTVQVAAAGDYFVGVSSAGDADYDPTLAESGHTGGSTATYVLALSVRPGRPLKSDLAGSSFRLQESTAAWGETVHVSFSVNNRGGADAGAFTVELYFSANPRIDPATSTSLLATPISVAGLAAGAEWSTPAGGLAVTLPAGLGAITSGPVYIGLRIVSSDPSRDSGTFDKGGVHRGADWESVTIVKTIVKTATGPTDLGSIGPVFAARITSTLTANQTDRYTFSLGPQFTSLAGQLNVEVRPTGNSGVSPRLALFDVDLTTGPPVVQTESPAGSQTATLAQYLHGGSYALDVSAAEPGEYQLIVTFTTANSPP